MPGLAVPILVLVLVAAAIGGSAAIGAPLLAVPIVLAILVLWGGARLASRRERPALRDEDLPEEIMGRAQRP